jgi:hypothetical protein
MKHTRNSDLERACKKASDDTIIAAHPYLRECWDMTSPPVVNDGGYVLADIAVRGVLDHLMAHIRHRELLDIEAKNRHEDAEHQEVESFLDHIRESDDEHLEQHYYQAKRSYLQATKIQNTGESLSKDDQKNARHALAVWPYLEEEVDRRGIREQMQRNQDLRNANFRPEDAERNPLFHLQLMAWITSIPGHQFQEKLDQCLRDVEVAMEVGEADLIWRERLYLDKLREYIAENNIVVEDTGK